MNNKVALISNLSLVVLLSGCAISKPIKTQNGKLGHSVQCPSGMSYCYEKASELCGASGYEILDKNNRPAGFFTTANVRLVIECK